MRRSSFKGKRRESVSDRKLIIIVVVLTSALSFTLGYFVGKATFKGTQPQPLVIESQSQAIAIQPQQETVPGLQVQPTQNAEQPVQNEKESGFAEAKVKGSEGGLSATKDDKPIQKQNADVYTVQAGAFKNSKDAVVLKRKLENKGYKAYIKKSIGVKNAQLFKVRTGEFADREKAEALALKLKNTEGLKAFVTFKNEKVHEEDKNSSLPRATEQERPR